MQKIKFVAIFSALISSIAAYSCSCSSFQAALTSQGVGLGGYWELTPKYYPKTVAYFDGLKEKYPALAAIPIVILGGPMADTNTIYFGMEWIEELEKGNKFYLQATEWIILHEMGHIAHYDIIKFSTSLVIAYLGFRYCDDDAINEYVSSISLLGVAGISAMAHIYYQASREYYADDYAMQHCPNPEAWLAAYEFLDRKAPLGFLPGIGHSFTTYRLSRIAAGFKEKFGYELEIVPQSLKPEYIA